MIRLERTADGRGYILHPVGGRLADIVGVVHNEMVDYQPILQRVDVSGQNLQPLARQPAGQPMEDPRGYGLAGPHCDGHR